MIFEQRTDVQLPASKMVPRGQRLWGLVNLAFPFLVLFSLLVAEVRFMKGLSVMRGVVGTLGLLFLVIGMAILLERFTGKRGSRKLRIENKGLYPTPLPSESRLIRWKNILRFQFEPAGPDSEFKKFTVRYIGRSPTGWRSWSMILSDAAQEEALLSELKNRQQSDSGKFDIQISSVPIPAERPFKIRSPRLWLFAIGYLFLFNGLCMLCAGLAAVMPSTYRPSLSDTNQTKINPIIVKWMQNHFSSAKELTQFYILTGTALSGMGAAGCGLSTMMGKRDRRAYQTAILEDENRFRSSVG